LARLLAEAEAIAARRERIAAATRQVAWIAAEQRCILEGGRHAARRAKRDEVRKILADHPKGITARMAQLKRIEDTADESRAPLARMAAEGEWAGQFWENQNLTLHAES
jgi:hypothetical protein